MQPLFPPGDTCWKNNQPQSAWREFNFIYHQVKRAIEPYIPLDEVLSNWNDISKSLAENHRKRKSQLSNYFYYENKYKLS